MPLHKKIGILGGGQLGRMFIENALRYNAHVAILDPAENAPCHSIAHQFVVGSFKTYDTVMQFAENVDVLSIEIEHVNTDALLTLEKQGKTVVPSAQALITIKDKGLQKLFYQKNEIASADFMLIENKADLLNHIAFLPAFQKLRKEGYDGKGVQFLNNENDLEKAFDEASILEKAVAIKKELSVIIVKNTRGEVAIFDTVELVFDPVLNLVDYLISPAYISDEINIKAKELALKVCTCLESAGIFAVELFLDESNQLLVNETAPRAHNSGHHTIESCSSSQFDQQLRVFLDLPLGNTHAHQKAAMLNIVGEDNFSGKAKYVGLEKILALSHVFVHLYDKEETKPGRKMGHITILGDNQAEILTKIAFIKANFKVTA